MKKDNIRYIVTAIFLSMSLFIAQPSYAIDLLKGLGKGMGIDEKTLNLIDKGINAVESLKPIGYEEEKAIGGALAVEVFNRFGGSYKDEAVIRYVNLIGKNIAQFSDRGDIEYHFAVLNNMEINAFAAPGGYVFVTLGLLKKVKNEAELAGVLAHEIAHITQRHTLQTIERMKRLSGISELTLTAMDKDPSLFADVIKNAAKKLFDEGLDQNMEYEADKFGIDYAYRTGYNPAGLMNFLETLNILMGKEESVFFKTHPSTKGRIDKISNDMPKYKGYADYPALEDRYKRNVSVN